MADLPCGRKKKMEKNKIESGFASDAKKEPRRIVFITRNTSAKVVDERGPKLMTYPNLLVREAIVFEVLIVAMVLVLFFWDAPLEQLANPLLTPNPAKAPWYFLGLQELLHFFPPFVAGILIPTLVLIALVVIPYFNVNVEGKPLFEKQPAKRLAIVMAVVIALLVLLAAVDAWTIIVPTVIVAALLLAAYQSKSTTGWLGEMRSEAALVVGDDVVHCHRGLPDSGGNSFPRPGLVLGVALGDTCRLKKWESCPTRVRLTFAVSTVVCVLVLAIAPLKDFRAEWKHYKRSFVKVRARPPGYQEASRRLQPEHRSDLAAGDERHRSLHDLPSGRHAGEPLRSRCPASVSLSSSHSAQCARLGLHDLPPRTGAGHGSCRSARNHSRLGTTDIPRSLPAGFVRQLPPGRPEGNASSLRGAGNSCRD